jgi:hypothetical protein
MGLPLLMLYVRINIAATESPDRNAYFLPHYLELH